MLSNYIITTAILVRAIAYVVLASMFMTALWRNHLDGRPVRILVATLFVYFGSESLLVLIRAYDRVCHIAGSRDGGLPESVSDMVIQVVVAACAVILVSAFRAVYGLAKKKER